MWIAPKIQHLGAPAEAPQSRDAPQPTPVSPRDAHHAERILTRRHAVGALVRSQYRTYRGQVLGKTTTHDSAPEVPVNGSTDDAWAKTAALSLPTDDLSTELPDDELDLAAPNAEDLTNAELESLASGARVELDVRSLQGRDRTTLVHDFNFNAEPGTVNLLVGATPAARWALACVLAGRLPNDRFSFQGHVQVAGRKSAPMLRSLVSLAQPWRIRDGETEVERRLRALDWAEPMQTPLVILSPGLDGLDAQDRATVMDRARQIAAAGTTVIVTAGSEHPGDLDDGDPLRGAVGTIGETSADTAAA